MGFTPAVQANLKALRECSERIEPWRGEPRPDLLEVAGEDEAYLLANLDTAYGIYCVLSGRAELALRSEDDSFRLTWINIQSGEAVETGEFVAGGQTITLETPRDGRDVGWAATLVRVDSTSRSWDG